jgi:Na+-driven multidrug efflux pump
LSVVNVVSGWVLLILGLMWGGPIGGAWGFVLSRTVSALVLWFPLLALQARTRK